MKPENGPERTSAQLSRSVLSDSLRPHELQHSRPPCPSPTPGVHSDSRFTIQQSESAIDCCSVAKSCPTLCSPMDCSTPGFPILHCLPEFAQVHIHWVINAIQPSQPLSPPSPPAFNLSQPQGLFQWVGSSHQVAKVLELQLQHQSFQWIFKVVFF